MYKRINDLQQDEGLRQMAFCAIYTIAKPYQEFIQIPKEKRGIEIPLVLMIQRWDGFIGFPGGNVDAGETLQEALVRELKEEINYQIPMERVDVLCSLSAPDRNIHCFCLQVDSTEIKNIIIGSVGSQHFLAENQGCFAAQIANFPNDTGYPQFRKHNFKASAGIELDILVEERLKVK